MIPNSFLPLCKALNGELELTNSLWTESGKLWRTSPRSDVYEWLSKITFKSTYHTPAALLTPKSYLNYWEIDTAGRVVRKNKRYADDVYLPNCNVTDVLEPDNRAFHGYAKLRDDLVQKAEKGDSRGRIAVSFYNLSVYQGNQIKGPLERFLQALLFCYERQIPYDPANTKDSTPFIQNVEDNCALSAIISLMSHFKEDGKYRPPYLKTSNGIVFCLYKDKRPVSAQLTPLITDLVNLAINQYTCSISRELCDIAVRLMFKAAATPSYNHSQLKLKKIIPGSTCQRMYIHGVTGKVPRMDWIAPREEYKFRISGYHFLTPSDRNQASGVKKNDLLLEELANEFGCISELMELRQMTDGIREHGHESMKFARDALALASSVFITRSPTETVMQEYTQSPDIGKPLCDADWSGNVGNVKYLNPRTAHNTARTLYNTWKTAAVEVGNSVKIWDVNRQAIQRSQYVTPRGGSGYMMRNRLALSGTELPIFRDAGVKSSTKIYQAAQVANLSYSQLKPAVLAPISQGIRNQVQRRARVIMPLNIAQQQASTVHTVCADFINKSMNLSTTSGSDVNEKVIPLGMYGSAPPSRSINIDIKACDASITNEFFLSLIMGAIHEGLEGIRPDEPYMGVPAAYVPASTVTGITSDRGISGLQNMAQSLSELYANGFTYEVNDAFCPGNKFIHKTLTFPSGSTATSTEHTANNSTMMHIFLSQWVPNSEASSALKQYVNTLSIKENYICQGDDGIMILPPNGTEHIAEELIAEFTDLLQKFGKESGWVYDIENNNTSEYLKLLFIFGCRIPNAGRHPVAGKERANREKDETWPQQLEVLLGMYRNGLNDCYNWREWLKFNWAICCLYAGHTITDRKGQKHTIQYPTWSFTYLGLPPIRVCDSPPFIFSAYTPQGDLGMYAILKTSHDYFMKRLAIDGKQLKDSDPDGPFGRYDHIPLFNEMHIFQGYYMAKQARQPDIRERKVNPKSKEAMIAALGDYLFQDVRLRVRVDAGYDLMSRNHTKYVRNMPSLFDIPRKWYTNAMEADTPQPDEILAMDTHLLEAQRRNYVSFSKTLEEFLKVDWTYGEIVEPAMDLDVPICAGATPSNTDIYSKLHGLGPMLESTKKYFSSTLFVTQAISGLDVNNIDATLLQMKALGSSTEALTGFLMTCGLTRGEATTIASRVRFQDLRAVQVARMVSLGVPDTWMMFNFDFLINHVAHIRTPFTGDMPVRLPPSAPWLRSIYQFLGSAITMTKAGPIHHIHLKYIRGGAHTMANKFRNWMSVK
uniref:RNA-directed RNA polymerase n=1 Tax=Wenzhou pacific spadenose shark reovirus 1 TaxID=2116343 RepID=A0A2P1GNB5_9REOV|nr:RNA-dependent RNA polymerase [Wenzhou pacific spadenose shark reovirus 1]